MTLPNYDHSILGIPNSILAHHGATPHHATLPTLDECLRRGYRNIFLLVLDGMGLDVLQAHAPDGFLMRHCVDQLSSVYPCTTTSALTTFETGLSPIEHGWLGWTHYFAEIDKVVELFTGKQSGTDRSAAERNIAYQTIGYTNLFAQINAIAPDVDCCRVSPFGEYWCDTNEGICQHLATLCRKPGQRYAFAYHFQPDVDMHDYGCHSERTKANIVLFDKQIEQLAATLIDTLLIVTADHGLADVQPSLCLDDYPDIKACLTAPPSREARSLSFHVRPDATAAFPALWREHFAEGFTLMTGDEACQQGIFGPGTPHPRARDFLGDFVALATGDLCLRNPDEKGEIKNYKGAHAGLTTQEMIVPLILVER